jgi:gluconate 2-dehydrogenase gamma chain
MSKNNEPKHDRRGFLKTLSVVAGANALGVAVSKEATAANKQPATSAAANAVTATSGTTEYLSFGPDEAAFVEALVNVMCPADQYTANGVDCGLAIFMDRQLAGAFGKGDRLYLRGPFRQGKPQFGYQLPLTPEQYAKAGIAAADEACAQRTGKRFAQLSAAEADAFLLDLAGGKLQHPRIRLDAWFRELMYPLFQQACFADPVYGGNRNKQFWKMIGYPGLPALHARNIIDYRGKPFPGAANPKSIADFS